MPIFASPTSPLITPTSPRYPIFVRYARPWLPIVRSHQPQQNMSPLFRPSAATPSFDPPARHRKPVAIAHRQLPIVLITLARNPETTAIRFRLIPTRTGQPTRDPAPDKQPSRSTPPSIATTIPRPLTIRQPGKPPPRFLAPRTLDEAISHNENQPPSLNRQRRRCDRHVAWSHDAVRHARAPHHPLSPRHTDTAQDHMTTTLPPRPYPSLSAASTLASAIALQPIHGFDCHCPHTTIASQCLWITQVCDIIRSLSIIHPSFTVCLLSVTLPGITSDGTRLTDHVLQQLPPGWSTTSCSICSSHHGDAVAAVRWLATCSALPDPLTPLNPAPSACDPTPLQAILDPALQHHDYTTHHVPTARTDPAFDPFFPVSINSTIPSAISLSTIAHPLFPAPEPCPTPATNTLSTTATIYTDDLGFQWARPLSLDEIARSYSHSPHVIQRLYSLPHLATSLPALLARTLPARTAAYVVDSHLIDALFPLFDTRDTRSAGTTHCLATTATTPTPESVTIPSKAAWLSAMAADPSIAAILAYLQSDSRTCPSSSLASIDSSYHHFIRQNQLLIHQDRLAILQPVDHDRALLVLVTPPALHRLIFSAYHASPTAGHMGYYKTLHRIRLRFFWPRMKTEISSWVKSCPHCLLTNKHTRRAHEIMFSWPVTSPLYMLHVDIWVPGDYRDYKGNQYLLTAMCDLTGFVVATAVASTKSQALTVAFFQEILLKVGMCGIVVVDAASTYLKEFTAMCSTLQIRLHPAARGNHKAVSVERFFRYLNKAVAIAKNDRDTLNIWVPAAMLAAYAWNGSAIEGTHIIRSVPAVGREFKFPIDMVLEGTPTDIGLCTDPAKDVVKYISQISSQVSFATTLLKLLIDDNRSAAANAANIGKRDAGYAVGDLVLVHVQVNSDASKSVVAKLEYAMKGPYRILECTGTGAYLVQRVDQPTSAPRKYPASALAPLPPHLFPCMPVDSADFRFLNATDAPIHHPLKRGLRIAHYNDVWFDRSANPPTPQSLRPHPVSAPVPSTSLPGPPHPSAATLLTAVLASRDKLFFVAYRAPGTLRPRWSLVQIDISCSKRDPDSQAYATTGYYFAHFFRRHPDDASLSNRHARWWPQWHRYSTHDGIIEYGPCILHRPPHLPDPTRFIAWSDTIDFTDPSVALVGPFDFITPPQGLRHHVPDALWDTLALRCNAAGVTPPSLSTDSYHPSTGARRSTRKRQKTK